MAQSRAEIPEPSTLKEKVEMVVNAVKSDKKTVPEPQWESLKSKLTQKLQTDHQSEAEKTKLAIRELDASLLRGSLEKRADDAKLDAQEIVETVQKVSESVKNRVNTILWENKFITLIKSNLFSAGKNRRELISEIQNCPGDQIWSLVTAIDSYKWRRERGKINNEIILEVFKKAITHDDIQVRLRAVDILGHNIRDYDPKTWELLIQTYTDSLSNTNRHGEAGNILRKLSYVEGLSQDLALRFITSAFEQENVGWIVTDGIRLLETAKISSAIAIPMLEKIYKTATIKGWDSVKYDVMNVLPKLPGATSANMRNFIDNALSGSTLRDKGDIIRAVGAVQASEQQNRNNQRLTSQDRQNDATDRQHALQLIQNTMHAAKGKSEEQSIQHATLQTLPNIKGITLGDVQTIIQPSLKSGDVGVYVDALIAYGSIRGGREESGVIKELKKICETNTDPVVMGNILQGLHYFEGINRNQIKEFIQKAALLVNEDNLLMRDIVHQIVRANIDNRFIGETFFNDPERRKQLFTYLTGYGMVFEHRFVEAVMKSAMKYNPTTRCEILALMPEYYSVNKEVADELIQMAGKYTDEETIKALEEAKRKIQDIRQLKTRERYLNGN